MTHVLPPDKAAARRAIRSVRRERRAAASEQVWRGLDHTLRDQLTDFLSGRPMPVSVASYVALPTEPPTASATRALLRQGVRVLVPVLLADGDLDWADAETHALLGVDAVAQVGLVLAPGLAVDRHTGNRLGQGGGSYDRALTRVEPGTPVVTVLFDDEVVDGVPAEAHDVAVDAVLTPGAGVRTVGGGRGTTVEY